MMVGVPVCQHVLVSACLLSVYESRSVLSLGGGGISFIHACEEPVSASNAQL